MPRFSLMALVAFALLNVRPASAQVQYTVTALGTLGGPYSQAFGVNNSGQVVGEAYVSTGAYNAFLYSTGEMLDLGTLGGFGSQANGINASSQIVGALDTNAFLYRNGTMQNLGSLGGSYGSEALAINAAGEVVGDAYTSGNVFDHAFLYTNGVMADLGTLGGGYSRASGINSSGQIVGAARTRDNAEHAFIYTNGSMTDLGTLSGVYSYAWGINDYGEVIGQADTTRSTHAFLFSGGAMSDLGALGGVTGISAANAINAIGQVVGSSYPGTGTLDHGMLWQNGEMYDLNNLLVADSGWTMNDATGINDNGWIVGYGTNPNVNGGSKQALLLIPAPEPGSFALLGLGLLIPNRRIIARRRSDHPSRRSRP